MKFDISEHIPNLSVDCVVFGFEDGLLKVLLSKFKLLKNTWVLPGGHIKWKESIDEAAKRHLFERTGIENLYLEQFKVFGDSDRIKNSKDIKELKEQMAVFDPDRFTPEVIDWMSDRFTCVGYYALVDIQKVKTKVGYLEEKLEWITIDAVPRLIHDHNQILNDGLLALRENLDRKLIAFNLLPETFTMKELLMVYETVYDSSFPMNNFQRKMLQLGILERLEKKFTGASNKAPYLYRFVHKSN
ncbi:NUDIX hydrolase [Jiulongibacter sp. NS-SX5]|uniref:NUDIX hydrolase n=1 Tax=Jiulongibacter sp. NS-SX5 TaxID=3463854 RepID=UPI004058C891